MKLLSISLGNQRGELEIYAKADVANDQVIFQAFSNGEMKFESEFYGDAREFLMDELKADQERYQNAH